MGGMDGWMDGCAVRHTHPPRGCGKPIASSTPLPPLSLAEQRNLRGRAAARSNPQKQREKKTLPKAHLHASTPPPSPLADAARRRMHPSNLGDGRTVRAMRMSWGSANLRGRGPIGEQVPQLGGGGVFQPSSTPSGADARATGAARRVVAGLGLGSGGGR